MPYRQDADLLTRWHEAVQRDEPGLPVRDDELADVAVQATACEGMVDEQGGGGTSRRDAPVQRAEICPPQDLECLLEMIEGARCVDYRRHGLGRTASGFVASRSIQACTSSAR